MKLEFQLPEFIYKFKCIDQSFFDLLVNSRIWFSNPVDFNDPFDSNIPYSKNFSEDDLRHFLAEFENTLAAKIKDFNFDEYLSKAFKKKQIVFNWVEKNFRPKEKIAIACFSGDDLSKNIRAYENFLMWSHYGNNHKGVCLKFKIDTKKSFFFDKKTITKKVIYHNKENFPELNFVKQYFDAIVGLVSHKSSFWEYENEVRICKISFKENQKGFYEFPKSCLQEITFGSEAGENEINIVKKIVKNIYPEVKFNRAVKSSNSFQIIIKEL